MKFIMKIESVVITLILCISLNPLFNEADKNPTIVNEEFNHNLESIESISDNVQNIIEYSRIVFTENLGQVKNNNIRFYTQNRDIWFTDDGVWFNIKVDRQKNDVELDHNYLTNKLFEPNTQKQTTYKNIVLKQEFVGSNKVKPEGRNRLEYNSNFFYGNDASKWITDVPNYQEIYYRNLYEGIDIKYYTQEKGLKYDLIVHKGAKVDQIKLRYEGVEKLELDKFGNLIIETTFNRIMDKNLLIYQNNDKNILEEIEGRIKLFNDFEYGFELLEDFNHNEILVIDPFIEYSTFIGGSSGMNISSGPSESVTDMSVDQKGNIYVTGQTGNFDFPTTPGSYNDSHQGYEYIDIFVLKLNSKCSSLFYSTFINGYHHGPYGGSGSSGGPIHFCESSGIAIDAKGNVYLTGTTFVDDFPTTEGAFQTIYNHSIDGFVLKLDSNGSKLLYSTLIGGQSTEFGRDIVIDSLNNAIITGETSSWDFPTTNASYDTIYNGVFPYSDIFVTKFNHNASSLLFSTFIGGNNSEFNSIIAIDKNDNVLIAGYTTSTDFPTTDGVYDFEYDDDGDIFVSKLYRNGSKLVFSTFLGGPGREKLHDFVVDGTESVFLTGSTNSSNFPTTKGAYNTTYTDGMTFITKLNNNCSKLIYSTFIGFCVVTSISVDSQGNAIITGAAGLYFPTTFDAINSSYNGNNDVFITKFNNNGSKLLFSTYIGGYNQDEGHKVIIDSNDNPIIAGKTYSEDFPITPGIIDNVTDPSGDIFICKISFNDYLSFDSLTFQTENISNNVIYSNYSSFYITTTIKNTASVYDIEKVGIILDPNKANIILNWNFSTNQFFEQSDPFNFVTITLSSNSNIISYDKITIEFAINFNWNYPDEDYHDIHVYVKSKSLPEIWFYSSSVYRVENDLVFIGNLIVRGEDNRTIAMDGLIRGGERLKWTGLIPVYEDTNSIYPKDNDFNVSIWDENGKYWTCSPKSGVSINLETITPLHSKSSFNYTVNITSIPKNCDLTHTNFSIQIDSDDIVFLNPIPKRGQWISNNQVKVGITITDIGGSEVNGSSIERCFSTDNGTTWSEWENISGLESNKTVKAYDIILFNEGKDNLIKWRAKDLLGNGPKVSEEYRILIDTENVSYSNTIFLNSYSSQSKNIELNFIVTDKNSGVNASTIEYSVSFDNGSTWSIWQPIIGYNNDLEIDVKLNLTISNSLINYIKLRAMDIVGNGPQESKIYIIEINNFERINISLALAKRIFLPGEPIMGNLTFHNNNYYNLILNLTQEHKYTVQFTISDIVTDEILIKIYGFNLKTILINQNSNATIDFEIKQDLIVLKSYNRIGFDVGNFTIFATLNKLQHSNSEYFKVFDEDANDNKNITFSIKLGKHIFLIGESIYGNIKLTNNNNYNVILYENPFKSYEGDHFRIQSTNATFTFIGLNIFDLYPITINAQNTIEFEFIINNTKYISTLKEQNLAIGNYSIFSFLYVGNSSEFNIIHSNKEFFTIVNNNFSSSESNDDINKLNFIISKNIAFITMIISTIIIITLFTTFITLTEFGKFGFFKILSPLYSKKRKKESYKTGYGKGAVFGYIVGNPGECYNVIKKMLKISNGTLAYYLKVLEDEKKIISERDGRLKRFYPSDGKISEEIIELNKIQKEIYNRIEENPGITQKEIVYQLNISQQRVSYNLKLMTDSRLIEREKKDKVMIYSVIVEDEQ